MYCFSSFEGLSTRYYLLCRPRANTGTSEFVNQSHCAQSGTNFLDKIKQKNLLIAILI